MQREAQIPHLVVRMPIDRLVEAAVIAGDLSRAGADGLLVETQPGVHPPFNGAMLDLMRSSPLTVVVHGSPALAAAAGAGVLLPQFGLAVAEARRQLWPGALLLREVESADAAALAVGVDALVAAWPAADKPADAYRRIIESASAPVLWRVDHAAAASALAHGAEGVIVALPADIGAALAHLAALASALPAAEVERPVVLVDGEPHPLLPDTAVTDLLAELGRAPRAVSRNGVAVARRRWDDTLLEPGDALETVD